MQRVVAIFLFLLAGCAMSNNAPENMTRVVVPAPVFDIVTYQRISDKTTPIHIYIEGDGHAFDAYGRPTSDPTPRGRLVRDMAATDTAPNVAYIARPCQFVMSPECTATDWTTARFSAAAVDAVAAAIKSVAGDRPVILVGYSGGAMMSALIISRHNDINVQKWITIAGVLNHSDWTQYFGDTPLSESLYVDELPRMPQVHYVAPRDKVVPMSLSQQWVGAENLVVVPGATHGNFQNLNLDFTIY